MNTDTTSINPNSDLGQPNGTLPGKEEAITVKKLWSYVKNPYAFVIALGITIALIYFVVDRIQFLSVAKHTTGIVESVTAKNERCSERRNKRTYYYDCTKFYASVGFDTLPPPPIVHSILSLSAGSVRGHNNPISMANRSKGQPTKVAYDPSNLRRSYEDTLFGIWGTPIIMFFSQITMLISSFTEKRKRKN